MAGRNGYFRNYALDQERQKCTRQKRQWETQKREIAQRVMIFVAAASAIILALLVAVVVLAVKMHGLNTELKKNQSEYTALEESALQMQQERDDAQSKISDLNDQITQLQDQLPTASPDTQDGSDSSDSDSSDGSSGTSTQSQSTGLDSSDDSDSSDSSNSSSTSASRSSARGRYQDSDSDSAPEDKTEVTGGDADTVSQTTETAE